MLRSINKLLWWSQKETYNHQEPLTQLLSPSKYSVNTIQQTSLTESYCMSLVMLLDPNRAEMFVIRIY